MESKDIIGIAPFGPFVEGFIRFSFEEDLASKQTQQLPQFEILSHVHDGEPEEGGIPKMVTHPVAEKLMGVDSEDESKRLLTEVPIRFLSKSPDTALRARYEAFDASSGRMVCTGNGTQAKRLVDGSTASKAEACNGPDRCGFAQREDVSCKFRCRMDVQIDNSQDPLAVFQFQSGGINTYRTLAAKLKMLHALYGDLRGLPLRLTSWAKSSKLSGYTAFYCANVELQEEFTLKSAGEAAEKYRAEFNTDGLQAAIESLVSGSAFSLDDGESLVTRHVPMSELRKARTSGQTSPHEGQASSLSSIVGKALEGIMATRVEQVALVAATESKLPDIPQLGDSESAISTNSSVVYDGGESRIIATGTTESDVTAQVESVQRVNEDVPEVAPIDQEAFLNI